jgi:hypothetical protein
MFRNPVEMTMNYGLYRRQRNVYVFKRAKSRMGAIFLSGGARHHSEYNFLD